MLPQPMTPTPNGRCLARRAHRAGAAVASPCPVSQVRLSRTAVSMSVAQRSSSTTCHSRGRAGGEDLRDRHPAGADRGHRVVLGDRAVLHVQVADPVAEPAEQGGDVFPADRRPVGVHLKEHGRVERVREHFEPGPPADRGKLEGVVVVAEPQSPAGRPGGGLVELAGERRDRVGVSEALRRDRRHDHRVRADGPRAVEQHVGVLAHGPRVHGAHGQSGRVEVGAERLGVRPHVEKLNGAVPEASRRRSTVSRPDGSWSLTEYNWRANGLLVKLPQPFARVTASTHAKDHIQACPRDGGEPADTASPRPAPGLDPRFIHPAIRCLST